MVLEPAQFTDSRFAQILGGERAGKFVAEAQRFFSQQRGPEELAKLFAIFRVGEHHAVITIGDWLKDTPELEVPRSDGGDDVNVDDFTGKVNQIGGVDIGTTKKAEFKTVDPLTGRVVRIFGFDELLNPAQGSARWRLKKPYMKMFENNFRCYVTSENGNVQVETIGDRPSPSDAQLSGDVQIRIVSQDKDRPVECTIYLDDVEYSSERSEFATDGPVRLVSQNSEMVGTGMLLVYNPAVSRLEYLQIVDLDYIHIKDVSTLSSSSGSTGDKDEATEVAVSDEQGAEAEVAVANADNAAGADNAGPGEVAQADDPDAFYQCKLLDNVAIRYGQQLVVVGANEVSISNILLSGSPGSTQGSSGANENAEFKDAGDVAVAEVVTSENVVAGKAAAGDVAQIVKSDADAQEITDVFVTCEGGLILKPMGDAANEGAAASIGHRRVVEVIGTPVIVREITSPDGVESTVAQCGVIKYDIDRDILDMLTNAGQEFVTLTMSGSDASLTTAGSVKWQRSDDMATINGPGKLMMRPKGDSAADTKAVASEMCFEGVMKLFFAKIASDDSMGGLALRSANLVGGVTAEIKDNGTSRMKSDYATFTFDESNDLSQADLAGNVSFDSENGSIATEQAKILFAKDADGKPYARSMQSIGGTVLEPASKDENQRPARFEAASIDYDIVTGNALAHGPVKFVFYATEKPKDPADDTTKTEPVPIVITADDNAEFFSEQNRIVFNGNVVGARESRTQDYTQKSTFYGDTLTVDMLGKDAKAKEGDVKVAHVTVAGESVKLESVRTVDGVNINHVILVCKQFDYDDIGKVVKAIGPGEIQINNANAPAVDNAGQKLSLEGPCFARISGFDELKWNTADNRILAFSESEDVNIGYIPIVDGKRGRVVNAVVKSLEAGFVTLPTGKSELGSLKASDGVYYKEDDGHEFMGDSLFYDSASSVMIFKGTEKEPCFADGARVPRIEYNMTTGDVKTELSKTPGSIAIPATVK